MRKIGLFFCASLFAIGNSFAAWSGTQTAIEKMEKRDGKPFYVISTPEELAWFAAKVNAGETTINGYLANDLYFGTDSTKYASTSAWEPIGKDSTKIFNGIFDGNNHNIYSFGPYQKQFNGLIGVLGTNGVLKNLRIANGDFSGPAYVGICGVNNGLIENVHNEKTTIRTYDNNTYKDHYLGGIAGINNGTIKISTNNGKLSYSGGGDRTFAGGITGANNGSITNVKNTNTVTVTSRLGAFCGGIAGSNEGTINKTTNSAKITAKAGYTNCYGCSGYAGGISGRNTNTITNSYNSGNTEASSSSDGGEGYSGELVAYNYGNALVKSSFSTGYASGYYKVSGIVGTNVGTSRVINVYYTGNYGIGTNTSTGTASAERLTESEATTNRFAWYLNSVKGTEANSGVWTRSDSYPFFADASNMPIYRVLFYDDGIEETRYTTNKSSNVTFPSDPEPAPGYIFTGWYNSSDVRVKSSTAFTSDQRLVSIYADVSNKYYTIKFMNANDTLLEQQSVQHGSIVKYNGETPTLQATDEYAYTFTGWNVEPTNATEDYTYTAVYSKTKRSYTIKFLNYNGAELSSTLYEYGTTPKYEKALARAATAEWSYKHTGWTPEIESVKGSKSYTAVYDSTKVQYTVTFVNGTVTLSTQKVDYGDAAIPPDNPTREGYKFIGWTPDYSEITKDMTIKALFDEVIIRTVEIKDNNGEVIENIDVAEGDSYVLPSAAEITGMVFVGWFDANGNKLGNAGEVVTISGDMTILAKYERTTFKVTFMCDSVVLQQSNVAYGTTPVYSGDEPTKKATTANSYTFAGWDEELTPVTGEKIYTATFTATPKLYKVTFISADTTVVEAKYNSEITLPEPKIKEGYSFVGWYDEDGVYMGPAGETTYITASSTISAHWKKTLVDPEDSETLQGVAARATFSLVVNGRSLQLSNARIGDAFAVMDMQGRVMNRGVVSADAFNMTVPRSGNYIVKAGSQTKFVTVR